MSRLFIICALVFSTLSLSSCDRQGNAESEAFDNAAVTVNTVGFEQQLGKDSIQLNEFVKILSHLAIEMEKLTAVQKDYESFISLHQLTHSESLYRDYVRVKLIFEATRDGGWWHLKWRVTDQEPNSKKIWKQWGNAKIDEWKSSTVTAVAECDELSALFAFLVRKLGVQNVGLLWPRWNHVVAVWSIKESQEVIRIVVPTSQVLLSDKASLGTVEFDAYQQSVFMNIRLMMSRQTLNCL